ncbi:MAG: magnesium/cobalt transporter CorA [Planctomycetota bacterium]|nr:magnesium/cobalt transporter CorA [Planctomycetota bacterium]
MPHGRRWRRWRRTKVPPGTPPGTITVSADSHPPVVTLFAYSDDHVIERRITHVEELSKYLEKWPIIWVNVDGLGDPELIKKIGQLFHLHPLALEDVVHTHQRPKVEPYDAHLFIVLRMVNRLNGVLESEQVSFFLGKKFVLTFQETLPWDSFEPVRTRLRGGGALAQLGSDYLAYRLIDSVIDGYFPVLEQYGERIEQLEDEVISYPMAETVGRVHDIKHDMLSLRRFVWPAREAINHLARDPSPLIQDNTRLYLRDCYDHTVQLMDLLETYRELASDLRDLYLSSASNRMGEVMKVLTIISTIFIPLTFIAGLYGMNFDKDSSWYNMPELRWEYGYPATLLLMLSITVGMLFYFRHKGWIGQAAARRMARAAALAEIERSKQQTEAQNRAVEVANLPVQSGSHATVPAAEKKE